MKKILILCLIFLLVGCSLVEESSVHVSSHITEADLVKALHEHGVNVVEAKSSKDSIFGSKLNRVKPGAYELDDKHLFIYEYKTTDERDKGLEQFHKNTEAMNVVSYTIFKGHNILMFYVQTEDLSATTIPYEKEINEALRSFVEG